ncbi:response regulator transcription factor [Polaromonas sp. YR568]|uniref:response regulator transcription factor n=1 Tax=Polaromonas sp. YR568 TaxID=1855301 RepID=UPI00398C1854
MEMIEGPLSILIVEDNAPLAANIYDYLEACGHKPDAAPDGKSGLGMVQANHYDAIVLDWMMPRMDGLAMLTQLRDELKSRIPVIMLTAKDQLGSKLQGFEAGADDYLVKPVALPELEMRLRVLVTRSHAAQAPGQVLEVGDLRFNLQSLVVTRGDRELSLSPIRRQILEVLMRRSPHLVSREYLESHIWGERSPDNDILRSHMHLLRKEVDGGEGARKILHTVFGQGYSIRVQDGE